jgi:hypothetical protein
VAEAALGPGTNTLIEIATDVLGGLLLVVVGAFRAMAPGGDEEGVSDDAVVGAPGKGPVGDPPSELELELDHGFQSVRVTEPDYPAHIGDELGEIEGRILRGKNSAQGKQRDAKASHGVNPGGGPFGGKSAVRIHDQSFVIFRRRR